MANPVHLNDTDIGLQPSAGIVPPNLPLPDKPCTSMSRKNKMGDGVWTDETQEAAVGGELVFVQSPPTKPMSVKIAEECQRDLTPRDLSMIEIGILMYHSNRNR